jgi:hypothetical protein
MTADKDCLPGDLAPATDAYILLNVFVAVVGDPVQLLRNERLPLAPHGFTWRMVPEKGQREG